MSKFVSKYYPQLLILVLSFSFFTRIYRLHLPEKYMFDEVYHAVTAKLISNNDQRAYEWTNPPPEPNTAVDWLHPPLAKYTQALSMKAFGQNSFGWRFSSAIFGVLVVFITARLALNLFKNKNISLMAAFIVSLDGLVLTMSRIAMNDIHVTLFILMALNYYVIYTNNQRKKRKFLILAAVSSGLALGTKWSGLFSLFIIGFFELLNYIKNIIDKFSNKKIPNDIKKLIKEAILLFGILIILPLSIYILSYAHMFLQGKDFNHLIEMHRNTWWYQTTLSATHPAQSRPLEWFLNLKPVWFEVSWNGNSRGDIYALGNPLVFWFGDIFIFATIVYLIYSLIKSKNFHNLFYLTFSYFAVWLPWQLSPRIMFFYHYLPAVPLLSINLAFWLNKLLKGREDSRIFASIILLSIFTTFILWYPHWVGIEVSNEIKNGLYFAIDSWKQK